MVAEVVRSELTRETVARVAPGTPLRDGLERILRGGKPPLKDEIAGWIARAQQPQRKAA